MKPRSSIFRFATAATVSRNRMKRNCDEMNREENIEKLLQKILGKQRNPEQMDSVQKMLREHIEASLDKRDLKTVLTKDQKTIELAQKIIADYIKQEGLTEDVQEYLEKMIIAPKEDNVNQKGSITVLIEPIEDSGYEKSWHEQKKLQDQKGKKRMICVGGPSAIDQALLASTIPQIAAQTDVVYISAGHWYSNLVNSALQFHARHGNALNASDALSGHALLASLVARKIIGLINNKAQALEAIENPAYCKIDVKFTLNPEKLRIYWGNEGNWLKQKIIKKILKQKDQHDLNREESVLSVEIIHSLQSALSEMLGYEFKIIEGNKRNDPNSSSIHVALTQSEVDKTRDENEDLAEIGIGSIELSRERIAELFGQNNQILSAFSYPGDGHLAPQYHINAQKLLRDFGQKSLEPVVVTRIFLCNENEAAKIAGVEIEEDGEKRFISADSLHISAGYMAKLQVVGSAKEATSNPTTVATGVSTNIILQRNFVVNNFIRYFGHTAELAVTNSHWTMLAKNDSYVIMRVTGGGNTGSESYNPNYFLNNIANTLRIYGGGEDEISPLVAIVRTYGCPRSINAINSTSFEKLGINFLTSYGKGGTGNTKRFFEAVVALCELGNEEEVLSYFSQFQTSEGINLGDKIDKVLQEFRADKDFFQDSVESISKEIGYKKFSGLMGTLLRRNNYIC